MCADEKNSPNIAAAGNACSAAQVYRWGCLDNRELPQPILNISFMRLAIGYFFYLIQATVPLL
jgi:hypothetical protein